MEGVLHELSLEQKVRLLTGADFWSLPAEPAIGLRRIVMSDGPAGVRGERWDEREPSANIPSPTALAATWDLELIERLGRLLAYECRRKGVDVLLAPVVNLHRSPYGGRHFECFSEDPWLTAGIGAAYVRGLQSEGVAATVKHFVANDSETERFILDARVSERVLRELYLLPFELILPESPWAVMAAYNGVNGVTMTESPLLREVLKDEWGFDGVVVSDWMAARGTVGAWAGGWGRPGGPGGGRSGRATPRWTWRCGARTGRGATRSSPPCATGRSARPPSTTRSGASCASRSGWARSATPRRPPHQ